MLKYKDIFADKLEKPSIKTIEDAIMTKDLDFLSNKDNEKSINTRGFLTEIQIRID